MSQPPASVLDLVERFDRQVNAFRSGAYKEAQVREEFINPFFEALGWDIYNRQGAAEVYKEVVHEDSIKVGAFTKAPDYSFRIGGRRVFFVEAKEPSVNLKVDPRPALQLRSYAWSAKLGLSLLTDFEELAAYDCRIRPAATDGPATARVQYLTYTQYPDRWDEIAGVFSHQAVVQGAFGKFLESTKTKKGTAEVDAAFLQDIEAWRKRLAQNLALRNRRLSPRELNFAVQRIIDRIIFLRICEDRGIEQYGQLQELLKGEEVYTHLGGLFERADQVYNSGLFHFRREPTRSEREDELTLGLQLDDEVLRQVIGGLYYPQSPYAFSVLPPDILGQVYEQFLGKVIRLTSGHQARVEDKPEVKKAGGVYYTPTHIVEYIVRETVGGLVRGKTPKEVAKLRILDPACGSGSFLIGAYQHLLDWYRDWYLNDGASKHKKELYQGHAGEWRLATSERKRILLNNIYGVDTDPQAVEVTKLSLLLKVLEGESRETMNAQLKLFHERALPDLGSNIKCGNSLVAPDFQEEQQMDLLDEDTRTRVNVFDWQTEFPAVFGAEHGGFDAVIGNPPYIRIQTLREWAPLEVAYFKKHYSAAGKGNYDIYVVFVERGLSLLNARGRLGFILPSKFLTTDYGASLRGLLARTGSVDRVVDFGYDQVFGRATTYTCLLFLDRAKPAAAEYRRVPPNRILEPSDDWESFPAHSLDAGPWLFAEAKVRGLLDKLRDGSIGLLELPASMSRGTSTGADDVFCLVERGGALYTRDGNPVQVESGLLRRPLYATDYTRYLVRPRSGERLIFPYVVSADGYALIDETLLQREFPGAYAYLRSCRKRLEDRKQSGAWFGYSAPRNLNLHDRADFLVPLLADRGLCSPLPRGASGFCVMASAGFTVTLSEAVGMHPLYVLGLVNSSLLFWNLRLISNKFRGGWVTCTKQYFGTLPIRRIDFDKPTDAAVHNEVVACVEQVLRLRAEEAGARTDHEKESLHRQVEAADQHLDRLVYSLYDLTEGEAKTLSDSAATS